VSFDIAFLKSNKYCFFNNVDKYAHHLNSVFDLINDAWENPAPKTARSTKEGYTFFEGAILPNILFVQDFEESHMEDIKSFMIESKAKEGIEKLLNSNIGICNVRAYRYTNNPPKEKTHYLDDLDHRKSIEPHVDSLPKPCLKIMIYKSLDSDVLTKEHGVIEVNPKGEWIPAVGKSPVVILFPPSIVLHRALRPAPGKIRDAIEITIIKRKPADFLVESCGPHAGYPKDIEAWNKRI
tara:strand:+ start:2738 stop:3451 length:714 start_codon:yes stop_codon:yes gene_type:complete